MISFIIIGHNEGWKLTKCLESIFNTINVNHLNEFEVIYVDSKSEDDSIERVKKFKNVHIIVITGDCNAAVARNVGAKESKGDVLFFVDGDMEIVSNFLPKVFDVNGKLIHDFISGQFINFNYNNHGQLLTKELYFKDLHEDRFESTTGGLFLITRIAWISVGGMRDYFKKSQDIDLGLRLKSKGLSLLRKKDLAANHHTISYLDKDRMWKDLFRGNEFYGRSLLYFQHIFNKALYPRLVRNDYTLVLLIIIASLCLYIGNLHLLIFYLLLIVIKALKISKLNLFRSVSLICYYIFRDIGTILGFFAVPILSAKKKFSYKIVTSKNASSNNIR